MLVMIEFDSSPHWKPGRFRSKLGGRNYQRIWWMWVALSWWPGNQKEYGEAIQNAAWIE
jgi:hypothetical protein